jgi:hypothetical protein
LPRLGIASNTIAAKDRAVTDDIGAEIPGREVLRILVGLRDDVGEDNLIKPQCSPSPGLAVLNSGNRH